MLRHHWGAQASSMQSRRRAWSMSIPARIPFCSRSQQKYGRAPLPNTARALGNVCFKYAARGTAAALERLRLGHIVNLSAHAINPLLTFHFIFHSSSLRLLPSSRHALTPTRAAPRGAEPPGSRPVPDQPDQSPPNRPSDRRRRRRAYPDDGEDNGESTVAVVAAHLEELQAPASPPRRHVLRAPAARLLLRDPGRPQVNPITAPPSYRSPITAAAPTYVPPTCLPPLPRTAHDTTSTSVQVAHQPAVPRPKHGQMAPRPLPQAVPFCF